MNAELIPLYQGSLGAKFWHQRSDSDRELLLWAMKQLPGGTYNGCDCRNHTIERVELVYATIGEESDVDDPTDTYIGVDEYVAQGELDNHYNWCLMEVIFHSPGGVSHGTQGGCADRPWTEAQLREYAESLEAPPP